MGPPESELEEFTSKPPKLTFSDAMKIPPNLRNLCIMCIAWLAASFNNYLVLFEIQYFPGNVFVNNTASCTSDILAFCTAGFLMSYISFEKSLVASYFIAILGGLAICFMANQPANAWMFPLCILIAKFGISSAYNICYMSNGLLFVTQISATTLGICNLFARTATIVAPFVAAVYA